MVSIYDVTYSIDIVLLLLAASFPLLVAVKVPKRNVRTVAFVLCVLLITHALMHTAGVLRQGFWAFAVFQPVSVILLIVFGLALDRSGL